MEHFSTIEALIGRLQDNVLTILWKGHCDVSNYFAMNHDFMLYLIDGESDGSTITECIGGEISSYDDLLLVCDIISEHHLN